MLTKEILELSKQLGDILNNKNYTITTAESCTGGLLSGAITAVAGSSSYFNQSWVTYSNNSKHKELSVAEDILKKYTAVSEEVVIAMAKGALSKAPADVAIAISGIAGPDGGSNAKPVGTVWVAVIIKNKITTKLFNFSNNLDNLDNLDNIRNMIRLNTVLESLKLVINKIGEINGR